MVIPCREFLDCPGSDFPITNYSAEGPERVPCPISVFYPRAWDSFGCLALCPPTGTSFDPCSDQNTADLCVIRAATNCNPCDVPPCAPTFCSPATTCSCVFSGGSEFFYTVPAGVFCADTQAAADALAHAYACVHCHDATTSINIQGIDACTCFGAPYSQKISYIGNSLPVWFITAGSLPSGLSLNPLTGVISGTPLTVGTFTFTVSALILGGNSGRKTLQITVLNISTSVLTDYELGVPYSFQMQASGGSGNYAWKLSSGTFPTGLSMTTTGLISGTPTAVGSAILTFQVADTACESINRTFYVPHVALTGQSTTRIATILGYNEFTGFRSTPPKKYKTITWTGFAEQRSYGANGPPEFQLISPLALGSGARWEFDGSGTINNQGSQTSNYSKNYFATCDVTAPFYVSDPILPGIITFGGLLSGYCWPNDPDRCSDCEDPFPEVGDISTNSLLADQIQEARLIPQSSVFSQRIVAAVSGGLFVRADWLAEQPGAPRYFLAGNPDPIFVEYAKIQFACDYSATLSDEYTDAIALANQEVRVSNGLVAETRPRTTGFVSTWTTVDYTLHFSNLLAGEDYLAQTTIINDNGSVMAVPYSFQATGPTHSHTASAPVPAAGHTLIVRSSIVNYATP